MTDRRSFFKSLALLGAAAAGSPGIFIPKFEPVKWRKTILFQPKDIEKYVFRARDYQGGWQFVTDDYELAMTLHAKKLQSIELVSE